MADIKLVINITKHEWEYLNKLVKNGDQLGHYERLLVNGIPLDDVKEPKNGERFSCPNCGFKADWFIPSKEDNTKESK